MSRLIMFRMNAACLVCGDIINQFCEKCPKCGVKFTQASTWFPKDSPQYAELLERRPDLEWVPMKRRY